MLKLLERNIESIEHRLVLLAPSQASIPDVFRETSDDTVEHARLVSEMQCLRGSIYLQDGAVRSHQLSADGRHETPEDERSWHLLCLNRDRRISACAWYLEHDNPSSIQQLRVRNNPLVNLDGGLDGGLDEGRDVLRRAVESELRRARRDSLRYAEVGGWAVARHSRCTSEGLLLALAAYSLGRASGGALGLTTATVRHGSSKILRRLGGSPLEANGSVVPPYYDPKYDCQMELLRFDSRQPNPKYSGLIDRLMDRLSMVSVIAGRPGVATSNTRSSEPAEAPCAA